MTLIKKVDKALKAAGCEVLPLDPLFYPHTPRLLVMTKGRRILLMDVHEAGDPLPDRKTELAQRRFLDAWKPCCRVVESVEDALRAVAL